MRINLVSCQMVKEKSVNYQTSEFDTRSISSPASVYMIATEVLHLDTASEEYFYIIMLNTKNRINGIAEISHGDLSSSIAHPREVFKLAMLANAASIICIHNHPSGEPEPSNNDKEITNRLVEAGDILGIKVHDHIIIGEDRYFSLKQQGLM